MASSDASPMPVSSGPKESRSDQVVAICLAMLSLSIVTVLARILIRLRMVQGKLGADDWAILVSLVFSIAFIIDVVTQTRFGLGKHIYDLPRETNFGASLELFYFGEALYYVTVATTKVAILFLYLRLATQKTLRTLIWLSMGFVIATAFACVTAGLFQCSPIAFAWDHTIEGGTCFNVIALFYTNAGLNIFQDLLIYILPMRMLYQLQIPKRQKVALMVVFAVGGFVCVTGIVRLVYLKTASVSSDPTWDNFGAAIWSAIESNTGIVCASLTHFKPLIGYYFPSLMGLRSNSRMKPLGDGSGGRSGEKRRISTKEPLDTEIELMQGKVWADNYEGKFDGRKQYGVAIDKKDSSGDNSSQEQLRGSDAEAKRGGIYKSTDIVVTRV